jgi:microsomal dipeptidase-like Zn-dependent dipeptidase
LIVDLHEDSFEAIGRHLDRITDMRRLEQTLRDRYGAKDAERICSGTVLRVLRAGWRS